MLKRRMFPSEAVTGDYQQDLLQGTLGLIGEIGEVSDLIKKERFHGRAPKRIDFLEELSDVLWYVEFLSITTGINTPMGEAYEEGDVLKALELILVPTMELLRGTHEAVCEIRRVFPAWVSMLGASLGEVQETLKSKVGRKYGA